LLNIPGIYIVEVSANPQPIEDVSTSTVSDEASAVALTVQEG
jgi:phage tail sheath protein FI